MMRYIFLILTLLTIGSFAQTPSGLNKAWVDTLNVSIGGSFKEFATLPEYYDSSRVGLRLTFDNGLKISNTAASNTTNLAALLSAIQTPTYKWGDEAEIWFKPGYYVVTDSFAFGNNRKSVKLKGIGSSSLKKSTAGPIFYSSGSHRGSIIEGLRLVGPGLNNATEVTGYKYSGTGGWSTAQFNEFDSLRTGLYGYDMTGVAIWKNFFDANDVAVHGEFQVDNWDLFQNQFSDNDTAIFIEGSSSSIARMHNNVFGQSKVADIVSTGGAGVLSIVDNYSEDSRGQVHVGTDDGNVNNGSRIVKLDGWNSQQGGGATSGDSIFYFYDTDFIQISNLHHTGTIDTTLFIIESGAARLTMFNNYAGVTKGSGDYQLTYGGIAYDSVLSGIALFQNPFLQRYNMNGYTTGKGYQQSEVYNFSDKQKAWEIKTTGGSNRNNNGSVSVSKESSFMAIGADSLAGIKFGRTAAAAPTATNLNVGNAFLRRYTNSNRDELSVSMRDGSNGFKNFDLLENRDSVLVPIEIQELGSGAVATATKDTITGSAPYYHYWRFDAATAEYLTLRMSVPTGVASTSWRIQAEWAADATTGNAIWGVRPYYPAVGADTVSLSSGSWTASTGSPDATSGEIVRQTWNFTMPSGLSPGQTVFLWFRRDASNGSDTMTGDARLINVSVFVYREWSNR